GAATEPPSVTEIRSQAIFGSQSAASTTSSCAGPTPADAASLWKPTSASTARSKVSTPVTTTASALRFERRPETMRGCRVPLLLLVVSCASQEPQRPQQPQGYYPPPP